MRLVDLLHEEATRKRTHVRSAETETRDERVAQHRKRIEEAMRMGADEDDEHELWADQVLEVMRLAGRPLQLLEIREEMRRRYGRGGTYLQVVCARLVGGGRLERPRYGIYRLAGQRCTIVVPVTPELEEEAARRGASLEEVAQDALRRGVMELTSLPHRTPTERHDGRR